jgi:threonine/homoserine/homoserine lactone efflux protein
MLVFAGAALVLLVIPGPAVLYITTRSVSQGRSAGIASVLGVHLGTLVHVLAAAVGLSALLVRSSVVFHAVKYAGAAYLVYLGVQKLRHRNRSPELTVRAEPLKRVFWQGVVVNILNPKTALFFFAFLPQFIDPGRGPVAMQAVVFGCLFVALGMVTDGTYAFVSAALGERLRRRARRMEVASGLIYIGLGVLAAKGATRPRVET